MADCIQNCPAPAQCSCSSSQTCVLVGRSCTSCGENVCQDLPKGKSGSAAGATAGEAIAGLIAGAVVAFLVYRYWFQRKRRRAIVSSQSQKVRFGSDTKAGSAPAPGRRSRMMSRQIGQEEKMILADEITAARKRNTLLASPHSTPDADMNPFADQQDVATDRPQSTIIRPNRASMPVIHIPSAYIPPHSNSMSIEEGQGEGRRKSLLPFPGRRTTIITSPQQSEFLQVPSPTSSTSSEKDKQKIPKPSRPAREGLDLKLPKMAASATPAGFGISPASASSPNAETSRPLSGFPWSAAPPDEPLRTGHDSHFSTSTNNSSTLAIPGHTTPVSRPTSEASVDSNHLSVMSHMSYLLDPPKIMTATAATRVDVVGPAQARTVQLTNPRNTPATTIAPNSPVSPTQQETIRTPDPASARESMEDPFADQVSHVVGGFTMQNITTPTFGANFNLDAAASHMPYERSSISSTDMHDSASDLDRMRTSVSTDDISIFTASTRPNTEMRHYSTTSSNRDSLLDGMPFMGVSMPAGRGSPNANAPLTPSSPYFPSPPPRSPDLERASVGSNPFTDQGDYSDVATNGENSPRSTAHYSTAPTDRYSSAAVSMRSGYGSMLENIPFQLGFPNDRTSMWSEASDGNRLSRPFSEAGSMGGGIDARYSIPEPVPPIPAEHRTSMKRSSTSSPLASQDATVPPSVSEEEVMQTPKMEQSEHSEHSGAVASSAAAEPEVDGTPKAQAARIKSAEVRASVDSFLESAMLANEWANSD